METTKDTSVWNKDTSIIQSVTEESVQGTGMEYSDDTSSICSSLEVVEALSEAVEDEERKTPELKQRDEGDVDLVQDLQFHDAMTNSQYAQVIFHDVADSYPNDCDVVCQYTLTPGLEPSHGDRVALYKVPYLQPHEYLTYSWAPMSQELGRMEKVEQQVVVPVAKLPKDEDFYQFQYVQADGSVAGASVPFQLRSPVETELCAVQDDEEDIMVVQTAAAHATSGMQARLASISSTNSNLQEKMVSMETKYHGLLDLSERLTEDLQQKTESFVVLDQMYKSLVPEKERASQLDKDMQQLVAEKVLLEETLHKTSETLARTESVLDSTRQRLVEVEAVASQKMDLEVALTKEREEKRALLAEKESLGKMLTRELAARENHQQERAGLLSRLEDLNAMLSAASKSKDLAVEELRMHIEQQDQLRRQLAITSEEASVAVRELVDVKSQLETTEIDLESTKIELDQTKQEFEAAKNILKDLRVENSKEKMENESVKLVQESVTSGMDRHLAIVEKNLFEKSKELDVVKEEVAGLAEIAKEKDEKLNILETSQKKDEDTIKNLENEITQLKQRLKMAAQHYRKLQTQVKAGEEYKGLYMTCKQKMMEIGMNADVPSPPTSLAASGDGVSAMTSISSEVSSNQMDSIAIQAALHPDNQAEEIENQQFSFLEKWSSPDNSLPTHMAGSMTSSQMASCTASMAGSATSIPEKPKSPSPAPAPRVPEPKARSHPGIAVPTGPSLFRPMYPTHTNILRRSQSPDSNLPRPQSPDTNLPPPLLPEILPTNETAGVVPELIPRQPAPYSSVQQNPDAEASAPPSEDLNSRAQAFRSIGHPTDTGSTTLECPICSYMFNATQVEELQQHVDQHLNNKRACPMCPQFFEMTQQEQFEEHVQQHFVEQEGASMMTIRDWDLGID